jgi:hypothetical protein
MKEPTNLDPRTKRNHHAITTVLGIEAGVDDQDIHRQGITKAHDMEEAKDPNLQGTRTTTKTMKPRWEHHALLAEFAGHQYPKDLSYPMINRSTMGHKNHNHGYRITCKQ